ncbi:MAG: NUDIX domain-containing protein [Prevotellaceae bacterium]|jgi:8-oxo-dGTP pyrophosphatase MutT (NUDIX family)|nr:NUDIX domain-containing protein [Prevotellaceae bacterium]
MIKIFFNDRLLAITDDWAQCSSDANAIGCKFTKKSDIPLFIDYFLEDTLSAAVYLVADNPQEALAAIQELFVCLEAAGGMVGNAAGEVLMIFRRNRWDLPKGHREAGESLEATALREVEEECGLRDLQLLRPITDTRHLYCDNGRWCMKCTRWFSMYYGGSAPPIPQAVEEITRAEWISADALPALLSDTYASVREVFMQSGGG